MHSKYVIVVKAHKNVHPSQDEILEAVCETIRKKISDSGTKSKLVSTFEVDLVDRTFKKS